MTISGQLCGTFLKVPHRLQAPWTKESKSGGNPGGSTTPRSNQPGAARPDGGLNGPQVRSGPKLRWADRLGGLGQALEPRVPWHIPMLRDLVHAFAHAT